MKFSSTNSPTQHVDLKDAVIRSLPADNGLYMPEAITPLPQTFWQTWRDMPLSELGFHIAKQILTDSIPDTDLKHIVNNAITFDAPLVTIEENTHILELFHGPTLAFKDFGARFMAQTMAYLTKGDTTPLTILVATSGDTGGAVASAFHNVEGTRVIILYPKDGVSDLQERQLTTLGGNIIALQVDGTFDDCQRIVKTTFLNRELSQRKNLTSANSINIARLIPQMFYYFRAVQQLPVEVEPNFVIPSGNFGNLTAGLLAQTLGLPVRHWVAATNINDTVPRYLNDGNYDPQPSQPTLSNAMDVGNPSNFARMAALFENDWETMRENISGLAFSDDETRQAIRAVKANTGYSIDPHGAVGYLAAKLWQQADPASQTIILETAHPSKFLSTMEQELGAESVGIPHRLASLQDLPMECSHITKDPKDLLEYL